MSWVLYCQPLARLKRSLLGEPSSFIWAKSENASGPWNASERVDDGGERCRRELVVVVELDQDVALRDLAGGELGGAHPANPGAGPLDPHPVVSFGWRPRRDLAIEQHDPLPVRND